MIPPPFDYQAPASLDEALELLAQGGEDAKVLAGGHSLLPLMKLRLAAPSLLVDLRKLGDLRGIQREDGGFSVGAMTPHVMLQDSPELGLPSRAAALIADQQVRNRGTIGGTLAHGDPAADLPAVMLVVDAVLHVRGPGGERTIPASGFFQDYLTTALAPGEIITRITFPGPEGWGIGYQKFNRRAEDWAMVAVAAAIRPEGGTISDARIGLTHMASTPLRATAAEEALRGGSLDEASLDRAAEAVAEGTDPPGDLNATPDYKRHLARVLAKRALREAAAQAG